MHYSIFGEAGQAKKVMQFLIAFVQTYSPSGQGTHHLDGQILLAKGGPTRNTVMALPA
jgi:hypothetical protein